MEKRTKKSKTPLLDTTPNPLSSGIKDSEKTISTLKILKGALEKGTKK